MVIFLRLIELCQLSILSQEPMSPFSFYLLLLSTRGRGFLMSGICYWLDIRKLILLRVYYPCLDFGDVLLLLLIVGLWIGT